MSYHADTFVLTPDGWKRISDVTYDDRVAEMHDGELVFSQPVDISSRNFSGQLINVEARNYGFTVTPEHGVPAQNRKTGDESIVRADDMHTTKNHLLHVSAPLAPRDHEIHDPDFARIAGMLRSNLLRITRRQMTVRILLSTLRPYLISLMDKAGVHYVQDDARFLLAKHPRLMTYFTFHGRLRRSTLLALDAESKRMFVQGAISWKARIRPPSFPTYITRFPPEDVAVVHELCALAGLSSTERAAGDGWLEVKVRPEQKNLLPPRKNVLPYSGRVYNLFTPSGTLLTRNLTRQALIGDGSHV